MKKTLLYDANNSPSQVIGGKGALIITTLFLLLSILLSSCTRNHGDIGPWFGTWHVESITLDGAPVEVYGDYFFQFQSTVFRVSNVSDHEQLVESFGVWDEGEDGTMTISFPDPDVFYISMPGLEVTNTFAITLPSSREAFFSRVTTSGTSVTYHLHKQP